MIVNGLYRDDMPAIPQESGSGERVVYSLSEQRVWLVAEDDFLIDTYLVSGRDWMPNVGTFHVWGKSPRTTGYNPSYTMNFMVRFAVGSHGGNIGFHDLPLYKGRPVPTTAELGQPLSGGCVRQDGYHARMMYAWTGNRHHRRGRSLGLLKTLLPAAAGRRAPPDPATWASRRSRLDCADANHLDRRPPRGPGADACRLRVRRSSPASVSMTSAGSSHFRPKASF